MADLLSVLQDKLSGKNVKIVLPEGEDERVLIAATQLQKTDYVSPIVLGNEDNIKSLASKHALDLTQIEIIDPATSELKDELVDAFVERRKGKATKEQAVELLDNVNYFGTMLVYTGKAEGLVSGAAHSTGDTVRPALQIIKTKPGVSRTSGIFFMIKGDEQYIFGDCAINPELDAQGLAEIAVESAKSAQSFGMDPKVAMLSFSTKGSAKSDDVTKVQEALKLAQEKAEADQLDHVVIDGEFQFDAAIVPSVAEKKAPGAKIQGDANVFVFPSLEAGNIGYKIAQRLGGYDAVGPVLQGLNSPVNDLSRGCSTEDVYNLSIYYSCSSFTIMDLATKYFNQINWRYVDHSSGLEPMQSFAFDDTFSESVGKDLSCNVVRTWIHQHTVILGIHDSRLPFLSDGIRFLTDEQGYNAIVRNSGGLGVVLDQGILNISLIFKGQTETTIDEAFTVMYLLINKMFEDEDVSIDTKEIEQSYCPGKFDLSINDKKFAGISQRRVRGGIAVQIYLCIEGSGSERALMMQQFYQRALKGETTKFHYPDIDPSCMASLETLLNREIKVQDVMFLLLYALKDLGANLNMDPITEDEWTRYEGYYDKMLERNAKMNEKLDF